VSESVFRLQLAIGNAGDDDQALCRVGDVREVLLCALEIEDYGEPASTAYERDQIATEAEEAAQAHAAEIEELADQLKKLNAALDDLQANYDALRELYGVAA
jgi:hypothetical protein